MDAIRWFFGALSPFEIIVAVVAFLTAAHTLYTILAKPKLRLYCTDSIGVVIAPRQPTDRFHLGCNLINPTSKVGTLHYLECVVLDPSGEERLFQWNLFFQYEIGRPRVMKSSDPFPIAVAPRNSVFRFIEFSISEGENVGFWPEGRYKFQVRGWINKPDRRCTPNVKATFHVDVDEMLSMATGGSEQSEPLVERVPVVEWSLHGLGKNRV